MTVKAVGKADTCRLFESLFKYRDLSGLMCQLFALGALSEPRFYRPFVLDTFPPEGVFTLMRSVRS